MNRVLSKKAAINLERMAFQKSFGNLMRVLRGKNESSMRQLCDDCGITRQGFHLIMRGDTCPNLFTAIQLSRAFDIGLDRIVEICTTKSDAS